MTKRPDVPDRVPFQDQIDYAIKKAQSDGDHSLIFDKKTPRGEDLSKISEYCEKMGFSVVKGNSSKTLKVVKLQQRSS